MTARRPSIRTCCSSVRTSTDRATGTSTRSWTRQADRFQISTPTTSAPAKSCGRSTLSLTTGEAGNETWAKDTWKNRTGNNVWAFALTVDEERGILYIPVSGSGANFYGGDRPGMNLFGNTLVALDANTGKLKWFFQTVHHELWDYNLPPAPGLIDIKKDGKTIPALAQVGKSGYMYILNRVTGEPVYGVEERPVDKINVPGEASYPTQPFPLKPPPISRTSMTRTISLLRRTPLRTMRKPARNFGTIRAGLHNQGPFTTFPVHTDGAMPNPRSFFRDSPAARTGAAQPPIQSSATFSSIRKTLRPSAG